MTNHKIRFIWAFVQQDLRINKGKKNLDCRSNLKDTFTKEIYFAQLLCRFQYHVILLISNVAYS